MTSDFANKSFVVTGGASGIGLATAHLVAQRGGRVVLFSRNESELAAACTSIGDRASFISGDVTSGQDLAQLYRSVTECGNRVDGLFINAGVAEFRSLHEIDEAHYRALFQANVWGAISTLRAALPHLSEGSSVVFNGSVAGILGFPNASIYGASKAAITAFARNAATELLPRGIRVNVVSPGPTETPILAKSAVDEKAQEQMAPYLSSRMRMGRLGKAEEVAETVAFLLSGASSFVEGQHIAVDGGLTGL